MRRPTVSIITPAFRAARFIGETIASARAQSRDDFEMLVVDDVSPDDTSAVVRAIASEDPRIRLLVHRENGGPAAARNTALAAARGRYIAFLDSDDVWLPQKLEEQIRFMEGVKAPISFTGYRRIDEAGQLISDLIQVPRTLDYQGLLRNTAIVTSSSMVDRSMTPAFRMKKAFYDDYVLWLELLGRGLVAHGLCRELVHYRVLRNSLSRNKARSALEVWRTYRDIEGLSMPFALSCFVQYAWNAFRKYRR